jgi:hypothetical protein
MRRRPREQPFHRRLPNSIRLQRIDGASAVFDSRWCHSASQELVAGGAFRISMPRVRLSQARSPDCRWQGCCKVTPSAICEIATQQKGTPLFDTIRSVILTRHSELVHRCFAAEPAGEAAFIYASYLYLRGLPDVDVAVDGWRMFRLVSETATSLRAIGIMHVLPSCELPIEFELIREPRSTRYWLRIGMDDSRWGSLSDSKRWKVVYLHAQGKSDEEWNWSQPVSGCLPDD